MPPSSRRVVTPARRAPGRRSARCRPSRCAAPVVHRSDRAGRTRSGDPLGEPEQPGQEKVPVERCRAPAVDAGERLGRVLQQRAEPVETQHSADVCGRVGGSRLRTGLDDAEQPGDPGDHRMVLFEVGRHEVAEKPFGELGRRTPRPRPGPVRPLRRPLRWRRRWCRTLRSSPSRSASHESPRPRSRRRLRS